MKSRHLAQRGRPRSATSFASSSPPIWWRPCSSRGSTCAHACPADWLPTAARLREPCGEFRHMWQRRRRAGEYVGPAASHDAPSRCTMAAAALRCDKCVHHPTLRSPRHPSVTGQLDVFGLRGCTSQFLIGVHSAVTTIPAHAQRPCARASLSSHDRRSRARRCAARHVVVERANAEGVDRFVRSTRSASARACRMRGWSPSPPPQPRGGAADSRVRRACGGLWASQHRLAWKGGRVHRPAADGYKSSPGSASCVAACGATARPPPQNSHPNFRIGGAPPSCSKQSTTTACRRREAPAAPPQKHRRGTAAAAAFGAIERTRCRG